jgi:hypothetical protein
MKHIRSSRGPFTERPHFQLREIEEICTTELRRAGLYPAAPEAIRIDRFIEKRFNVRPRYESLPEGVLGFTLFGKRGVEDIIVAKSLDDAGTKAAERRLRSTFAHEAGHGLLHAHLFCLGEKPKSLFDGGDMAPKILCREVLEAFQPRAGYSGKWWEFQANRAIGGLLLPRPLVIQALESFCMEAGKLGGRVLKPDKRETALHELSTTFEVNPAVARIRLEEVFPAKSEHQLLL